MRQVIALVTSEQVQFALLDDEAEELTQFAQIKTPTQFTLHEAALLGTNLIEALGLNSGPKRGRPKAQPQPEAEPVAEAQAAVDAKRKGRGSGQLAPGTKTKMGYTTGGRYVEDAEVLAVINRHPEGTSIPDIAKEIQRPSDEYAWMRTSVNNRISNMRARAKKGVPLPYREGRKFHEGSGQERPLLLPLEGTVETLPTVEPTVEQTAEQEVLPPWRA